MDPAEILKDVEAEELLLNAEFADEVRKAGLDPETILRAGPEVISPK